MKPIHLRLSGLNSFREPQDIDFSKLCETGVFGIFGPTGSGKSSILDAITLALYGTVARAVNNTQGILNHGEDSLAVEFTFSLGTGHRRQVYRAERSYKRSGDKTVKAATCRLVQLSPEESVLASKADEMTDKVQQILGLNAQDFTRAVVLPQGKFAEFLTLKPKDRRQMLERLFNLEIYGGRLSARVSDEYSRTQLTLTEVTAHQQGLGDASSERLQQAEIELKQAQAQAASSLIELNRLQQDYDEAKKIRRLQEQIEQCQNSLAELSLQQNELEVIKHKLLRAEQAEQVRPWLEEVRKYERTAQDLKGQVEALSQQLSLTQTEFDQLNQRWTDIHQKRLEKEPQILRRLEQVNQGIIIEGEKQIQEEHYNTLRQRYKETLERNKAIGNNLAHMEEKLSELRQQEINFKNRLHEITILPEERALINEGIKTLDSLQELAAALTDHTQLLSATAQHLKAAEELAAEASAKVEQQQKALELCQNEMTNHEQTKPTMSEEVLSQRALELERIRSAIGQADGAYKRYVQSLTKQNALNARIQSQQAALQTQSQERDRVLELLNSAKNSAERIARNIQELENDHLASKLALTLKPNAPCPVCGSTHHPQLAKQETPEEIEGLNQELTVIVDQIAGFEKTLAEIQTNSAVAENNLQNLLKDLEAQSTETALHQQEYDEHVRQLPAAIQEVTNDERIQYLSLKESTLKQDWDSISLWKQHKESLEDRQQGIQKQLRSEQDTLSSLQLNVTKLKVEHDTLTRQLNALKLDYEKAQQALHRIGLKEEVIRDKYALFLLWDKENVTLNQALKKTSSTLNDLEQEYRAQSQHKAALDLDLKQIETEGKEVAQAVREKQEKLQLLLEGKPGEALYTELNQELKLLQDSDTTTRLELEKTSKRLQDVRQQHAVLERELQIAVDSQSTAAARLNQELKRSGFDSVNMAEDSLCSEEERQTMRQTIADYEKRVAFYNAQLQKLTQELEGRHISDQEWLSWPEKMELASRKHNQALEVKGAAERTLYELTKKHNLWNNLEQQRSLLETRLHRIKLLQNLLRGNAFVEFMAEEQLNNVALSASERLGQLTNYRYALELDSDGGFIMRDNANGGYRRPVNTLSGGETFLTSLALALALSTQIQLKGEVPLEFFFLDEGFGTLDPHLLEVVMQTLETLHLQNLTIGIISHVPELQNRLARRLIVTPSQPGGTGSRVRLEYA